MTEVREFDPERDAPLLSAYVDGELEPEDAVRVEAWLAASAEAREEVRRLRELKHLTSALQLREPPPEAWEAFWTDFWNRGERGLGWTLLVLGALIVGGYALLRLVAAILAATLPVIVRLGIFALGAGLVVLLVSVLRERIYARKHTRYKDVKR